MLVAIYSVLLFIALGYFAKRARMLGNRQGNILLGFLLNFSLPSAIFKGVYHSTLDVELMLSLFGALACSILGAVLVLCLALYVLRFGKEVAITMSFLTCLHNTLFLGVPMVEGALGSEAAHNAILFDQFCTGLPLAILTPIIMSLSGKGVFSARSVGIRLFQNPLFLAMLSGFALKALPFSLPQEIFAPIYALAACATPVALFAIGVQLSFGDVRLEWQKAGIILVVSMLVIPAIYLCSLHIFGVNINSNHKMALLESSMPPLISSAAVIARAGLNNKIAVASIVMGIFFSAITTPLWVHLSGL
ncbi:AEC family transporter [Helicobacter sp. MIT 01-3238]|uniref:AEC family transporter n=1 Tax=Helicobacter sp. MIT 01-3238 TaxID=398627 RepID=UPI000E1E5D77|nr:AEC family transporter [Helicobacter sp. MIT 01-3238]RDU51865.1 AEC family transporter [Helicobacter sp. MIT 01-3238]